MIELALGFDMATALRSQRESVAKLRPRFDALAAAIGRSSDLTPPQWAQLYALTMEFRPDLIIELGRGYGNSTVVFTEAANQLGDCRVLSLCRSADWEIHSQPAVARIVEPAWFERLDARRGDILQVDYTREIGDARRVLVFWDAHGFTIAGCVLSDILPRLATRAHVVAMHDISDSRYSSDEVMDYKGQPIWTGNNWDGPRLFIGDMDTAVEQAIAIMDFAQRNKLPLHSADQEIASLANDEQARTALERDMGPYFALVGGWRYFTLAEAQRSPITFPTRRPTADAWADEVGARVAADLKRDTRGGRPSAKTLARIAVKAVLGRYPSRAAEER